MTTIDTAPPRSRPHIAAVSDREVYTRAEDAERNLTVGEAIAAGWTVAELMIGDEILRSYGHTYFEARQRLAVELERYICIYGPGQRTG
jgi:hypothetical protein